MPSKLRKAIAAMKDQTSISLAKVGGAESSTLEVAILKATTHDEIPVDEIYITDILRIVSSNETYAGSCARALGRRIGRTRNWVVALKSLMIVLRVFQDGDPHFPKEILHAMKRGYKILNLNSFRDDSSTSCPWDLTAFVRTFALYLDERLDCFLTGKLQRRKSYQQSGRSKGYSRDNEPIVRDMKPSVLLDRILHWQKLLDRAIATQPTGAARTNQVVQTCLYAIVQETFDLYRDISDGLALLLDSFFHLQYNNCVSAFQTCVKASKQFSELATFYDLCKSIGVGRTSEYPSVQKISEELVETLQEFLKDQSSFPGTIGRRTPGGSGHYLPSLSPNSESDSVRRSEYGESQCTSLEDLIGGDHGFSPKRYSDPGREKPPQLEESYSANDTASVRSEPIDHRGINSVLDLLSLDDPSPPTDLQQQIVEESNNEGLTSPSEESGQGWELVLFETATNQPSTETTNNDHNVDSSVASNNNGFEVDFSSDFNAPSTSLYTPLPDDHTYNPFLQDSVDLNSPFGAQNSEPINELGSFGYTSFGPGCTNGSFSDSGFPTDLGVSVGSATPQSTFEAGLPLTFHPELGNVNTDNNHQLDLFDDPGRSSNFSSSTNISLVTHGGHGEHNRSLSTSVIDNFGQANTAGMPPTYNKASFVPTTHHARFASTDFSSSPFSVSFHNVNASIGKPTIHHARYGSNLSTNSSAFSENFDCFSGYSSTTVPPTFPADSGDGSANAMNAIVPFGQVGSDDFFSSSDPKLQATPTFLATSLDMDQHQQSNLWNENDPFGSFPTTTSAIDPQKMSGSFDQQNIMQQQQLWLQNQNKIMAKHLT
ncbi:clathrin coat assembly protein AP180-like [Chenopodium quinoa]|uniref:ENTH domain-containing protein n=1 Tax=Chenopodium quinoa TaxID=63459 RepID=A0A803LDQ4_CHEQI|nr:clathrin coat assembly protein AP180-like [Chenopodium quinoa]